VKKKILIVVDPQNDFCDPKGSLYVAGSEKVFDKVNALLDDDEFFFKVVTQDWHPKNHVSFASTHGAEVFTQKDTLQGTKKIKQTMWPDHCVEGTWGAEIHQAIHADKADVIYRKGRDPNRECYSAFRYVHEGEATFNDNTTFYDMMADVDVEEVYICGFATDFCVKATAISANELFPKVIVVHDACRAVDQEHEKEILSKLIEAGIYIEKSLNIV
jgi:nicotinamidase/pyrazinamidase